MLVGDGSPRDPTFPSPSPSPRLQVGWSRLVDDRSPRSPRVDVSPLSPPFSGRVFLGPKDEKRAIVRVSIALGSDLTQYFPDLPTSLLLVLSPSFTAAKTVGCLAHLLTAQMRDELTHARLMQAIGRCRLFQFNEGSNDWALVQPTTKPWNEEDPKPPRLLFTKPDSVAGAFVILGEKPKDHAALFQQQQENKALSASSPSTPLGSASPRRLRSGSTKGNQKSTLILEEEDEDSNTVQTYQLREKGKKSGSNIDKKTRSGVSATAEKKKHGSRDMFPSSSSGGSSPTPSNPLSLSSDTGATKKSLSQRIAKLGSTSASLSAPPLTDRSSSPTSSSHLSSSPSSSDPSLLKTISHSMSMMTAGSDTNRSSPGKPKILRSYTEADQNLEMLGLQNTFKSVVVHPTTTVQEFNASVIRVMLKGLSKEHHQLVQNVLGAYTHFLQVPTIRGSKRQQLASSDLVLEIFDNAEPGARLIFCEPATTNEDEREASRQRSMVMKQTTLCGPAETKEVQEMLIAAKKYLVTNKPLVLGPITVPHIFAASGCRSLAQSSRASDTGPLIVTRDSLVFAGREISLKL